MFETDRLLNYISIEQNSILTWLAAALAAMIGVIELSGSDFSGLIEIAFALILFIIFFASLEMIVVHMETVFVYRSLLRNQEDHILLEQARIEQMEVDNSPLVNLMNRSLDYLITLRRNRLFLYLGLLVLALFLYNLGVSPFFNEYANQTV